MTVGELFAGIGGFSLGFRRAGFDVKWQVEIDPYCRKVLAKNFPEAERFEDVRTVGAANLQPVDVICGGFPCQDISYAGLGAGIDGERSGLWREYARIIGDLRPRFAVVENVPALLSRGLGRVLGDLAAIGYDAEWEVVSAADAGAPHLRERVWIVAYPSRERHGKQSPVFDTGIYEEWDRSACKQGRGAVAREAISSGEEMANAISLRQPGQGEFIQPRYPAANSDGKASNAFNVREGNHWEFEPAMGRVVDGIPPPVDELRALGNAVVPQIPEWIAKRILQVN